MGPRSRPPEQMQAPCSCDHIGDDPVVFKTFNPSLNHRVHAKRPAMDYCIPMQDNFHIIIPYGFYSQYLRLGLEKLLDMFQRCANGIFTLSLHQLIKPFHLPLYTALVVSVVSVRIVLIATSEKRLSWREHHSASTQST